MTLMIVPQTGPLTGVKTKGAGSQTQAQIGAGPPAAAAGPLGGVLGAVDPERQQALNQKAAEAQQAIETLEATEEVRDDQRQSEALRKIEEIKARLHALRFFAGVNPKAAARQVAQLSEDLAAAVKDYVAAGGNAGSLTLPADSTAASPEAAAIEAGPAEIAGQPPVAHGAIGGGGNRADAAMGSEPSAAPSTVEEAGAGPSAPEAAADTSDIRLAVTLQIARALDNPLAETGGTLTLSQQDRTFETEVRLLITLLENTLEANKRDLRIGDAPGLNQDVDQAKKDLQKAERTLDEAVFGPSPSLGAVSLLV